MVLRCFKMPGGGWGLPVQGLILITGVLLLYPDVVHGADPPETPASGGSCASASKKEPTEGRLLKCLMENYDPAVRPVSDHKKAVNVSIQILLVKVVDLDERAHTFETNVWIYKSWQDSQLTWDPKDFDGITYISVPTDRLWKPDLILYNNAATNYGYTLDKMAVVAANGTVHWSPHARLNSYCYFNFKYFPYDTQRCIMYFGSWTYDVTKVDFILPKNPMRKHVYDGDSWKITSFTLKREEHSYGSNGSREQTRPVITLHVDLQRQGAFYQGLMVTPSILIGVLVAFVFLIPPGSNERLTFAIGLLICQAIMLSLLEDFAPSEVGYMPIVGVHLILQMIMVTVGIILSIGILDCYHRGARRTKVPNWLRQITLGRLSRILCLKPDMYTSVPTDLSVANGGASELRTADELGLETTHTASSRGGSGGGTMEATLEDIRRYLRVCAAKAAEPTTPTLATNFRPHQELVVQEWQQVALVLDRVLFLVYVVLTVFGALGIFMGH